ncbi:MAG: hypothetical protein Q9217_005708 [Psora testacea]
MELYLVLAIPVLIATAWLYTAQKTRTSLPILQNKRICLLIAHPDDEAMFFSPTLSALTNPALGNHVKILCLSSGDADGLGEVRKKELGASAKMLGFRTASDVLVLEHAAFPDNMTVMWPKEKVVQVLSSAFSPPSAKGEEKLKGARFEAPNTTIDVLITFDKYGVSLHPNHISLFYGAKAWLADLMAGKSGWRCPVELYTLTTTNILRKYLSFLDGPTTLLIGALRGASLTKKKARDETPSLVFISSFGEYRKGRNAMTQGHKSQMRWFRWGWIGVGRYMVVNDLKREIFT